MLPRRLCHCEQELFGMCKCDCDCWRLLLGIAQWTHNITIRVLHHTLDIHIHIHRIDFNYKHYSPHLFTLCGRTLYDDALQSSRPSRARAGDVSRSSSCYGVASPFLFYVCRELAAAMFPRFLCPDRSRVSDVCHYSSAVQPRHASLYMSDIIHRTI